MHRRSRKSALMQPRKNRPRFDGTQPKADVFELRQPQNLSLSTKTRLEVALVFESFSPPFLPPLSLYRVRVRDHPLLNVAGGERLSARHGPLIWRFPAPRVPRRSHPAAVAAPLQLPRSPSVSIPYPHNHRCRRRGRLR